MKYIFSLANTLLLFFSINSIGQAQNFTLIDAIKIKDMILVYKINDSIYNKIELEHESISIYNKSLKDYQKDSSDLKSITNPDLFGRKSAELAALKAELTRKRELIELNTGLNALLIQLEEANAKKNSASTEILTILQQYIPTLNQDNFLSIINAQPFLKDASIGLASTAQSGVSRFNSNFISSNTGSLFSSAANLDVTNFALGLTDFLVERTKTELNTAFFKRFQEEMNKPQYKDLRALFPETVEILDVIGVEVYQFDHYLNSLRSAFDKDLRTLLEHLPTVVENHRNDPVFLANPALEPSLLLTLDLAGWVKDGTHPGEMLLNLSKSTYTEQIADLNTPDARNATSGIRLAALLSESLRNANDSLHYWVNAEQLKKLKDETTLKIYLGLLYQVSLTAPYNSIVFINGTQETTLTAALILLADNWDRRKEDYEKYRAFILKLGKATQTTMEAVDDYNRTYKKVQADTTLSKKERLEQIIEGSFDVFDNFIGLVKIGFEVENLPHINVKIPEKAKVTVHNAERGGEIALLTVQKQYAGAVSKLVAWLDELLDNPEIETIGPLRAALADPANASSKADIEKKLNLYDQKSELQQQLDLLKAQPKFEGKDKQVEGLKKQIELLEGRAKLITIPATSIGQNGPLIKILTTEKDQLLRDAAATGISPEEATLLRQQADAIVVQIDGLKLDIDYEKQLTTNKQTLKKLLKYGTFMANIVEADSPEDAKKAIEAIALPPGSYTVKRESKFSVGLNGYLGVFYGTEHIDSVATHRFNNVGITAPVGVALNWGNIFPKWKNPMSIGLFIPLIDLGAVASYRVKTDTIPGEPAEAQTVPTIQLKHIIAPGLFVEAGIPCTPLTLGFGAQMGPRLRGVEPNGTTHIGDFYYRFGFSLKVDIPILHFHVGPGKR